VRPSSLFFCSILSLFIATPIVGATSESLKSSPPPARATTMQEKLDVKPTLLSDLLTTLPALKAAHVPGFYAEVSRELDGPVRRIAEENYTSAVLELEALLAKTTDKREQARLHMWLGIAHGQRAIDYPNMGWTSGTSATIHLKKAGELDDAIREAPDVARIFAEMIGNGWTEEDPITALAGWEKRAEQTRSAIDFYIAGIISKRLSAKAWAYSDTTEQDKRTLKNFARAVARDPGRYESWAFYVKSLMPVGLHDLATTETNRMYEYFKPLRTPLLSDQGPAFLLMTTAQYRTMKMDEDLLDQMERNYPERPFPLFEKAMRAIETTAPDALKLFPEFLNRVQTGIIKMEPREQGYLPSAHYKLGFLKQQFNDIQGSLEEYTKVKEISPTYAEINLNLAIVKAQLSDQETTGPKKLQLLREAIDFATEQEKLDFRGRASLKAQELRLKLRQMARAVEKDMSEGRTGTTTGTASQGTGTTSTATTAVKSALPAQVEP